MTESTIKSRLNPQRVMGLTSKSDLFREFKMLSDESRDSKDMNLGLKGVELLDAVNYFRLTPEEIAQNKKIQYTKKQEELNMQKFNFMSLFLSNSFVYNDKKKYVPSPLALESKLNLSSPEVLAAKSYLASYSMNTFTAPVWEEVDSFLKYKWGKYKGVFIAEDLARGMTQYGLNDGSWDANDKAVFMHFGKQFVDQTKYELAAKWPAIPDYDRLQEYRTLGPDGWLELLKFVPYLGMIDLTSSSGYPHWRPQSIKHIYEYAGSAYEDALIGDFMTIQSRTQGGKVELVITINILKYGNVSWKIRVVLAASFPIKIITSPESYLWKLSEPNFTHYYKDGSVVQNRILDMVRKAKIDESLDVYNTDLSLADQTQDMRGFGALMNYDQDNYFKFASPDIGKYIARGSRPIRHPYVLINPRQLLKFPRMIAPSGHPKVPKIESASVDAVHMAGLVHEYKLSPDQIYDLVGHQVKDKLIQIDDLQMLCEKFDLDSFTKYVREKFGAIISSSKTNTFSKDGYVIPLKVFNGYIYNEMTIKDVLPLDGSDPSDGSYFGRPDTKTLGLFDHETGTKDDSPIVLVISEDDFKWADTHGLAVNRTVYIGDDGTHYLLASKPLQSLFGTLTSFGDKVDMHFIKGLHAILHHLPTWKKMIAFLRRQDSIRILSKDYGFGKNDKLISYLIELYDEDVKT